MASSKQGKGQWSSLKAFIIAPIIFLVVLGAIYAYSGIWPPMVVIESKSMQHGEASAIGIIDTGDIVIVKQADGEVVTYIEGVATGHYTYGEAGDVVIYYKSGMAKPIIHRAICELEYNFTGGGFDIPALKDLPAWMWSVPGGDKVWWNLKGTVELYGIGHANVTVPIDLAALLAYMNAPTFAGGPHGGLITMGDNNYYPGPNDTLLGRYDQKWISSVREPIAENWVIGKARGELPWFGLLKLYATGTAPDYTPRNSQVNLVICLVLLIAVPMTLDISLGLRKRKEQSQSRERERPPPKP